MAKKSAAARTKTIKRSVRKTPPGPMPRRIYAIASPHSVGGVSMFEAQSQITSETAANFFSEEEIVSRAVAKLQSTGFDLLQVTQATIQIAGSPKTYAEAFGTQLVTKERPVIKPGAEETTATFIECPDTDLDGLISTVRTPFADVLEGIAIEEPRYYMAPSSFPPAKAYWHLDVPGGVSLGCNADRAHRAGITGKGLKVAMVDSGHYAHPFFQARGYRVSPVVLGPGATDAADDASGHGTGESCNIFAIAPDVQLLPVKMNFVNSTAAFNAAVALGPDIITCSWGSSVEGPELSAAAQALAAAIATAVASGIVVVFSAGNGHFGFPGQHPDVISAGGTYMKPDGTLTASDYASGFISRVYPNRRVPDLCGLVGMTPKAIYIMLPVQPSDEIDRDNAGSSFPNGDETATDDGWAAFSGTSAAAPQLAGAAALVRQAHPNLTPAQVRSIMMNTARDVATGHSNIVTGGFPAKVGPDTATGNGLIDVERAALVAKLQFLSIHPMAPVERVSAIQPARPVEPTQPVQRMPAGTISAQAMATARATPVRALPKGPIRPVEPSGATYREPQQRLLAREQGPKLSPEEVRSLEEMAGRGELGFHDFEE